MKRILALCALSASAALAAPPGRVAGSKHDFTATGTGEIHAADEAATCVFCHGPHGTGQGLSNRPDSPIPARLRGSGSLSASPGQLGAGSRACLSCHDGTVAVGATRRGELRMVGSGRLTPGRRGYLGTDLSGSHPLGARLRTGLRLRSPSPGDPVKLDRGGLVQCTSCHDPHVEDADPLVGKFLVKPSQRSALCLSCHDAAAYDAAGASHASADVTVPPLPGAAVDGRAMAEAGCSACHLSHGAEPESQLVARPVPGDPDSSCLRCHATGAVRAPIGADLARSFSHRATGRHEPTEGPDSRRQPLPERSPGQRRHVTCVDCHDPHVANGAPAQPPFAGGPLAGVWGIDLAGGRVESVRFEYEVCFKCHGDSANKPQSAGPLPPETVRRARIDVNLRKVFGAAAPSSHPVAAPGRNPDVPSLIAPLTVASQITCSDCHGSDAGAARGPHGSDQPHILRRAYQTAGPFPESPGAYALCYGCHDRERLLFEASASPFVVVRADASRAPLHGRHVVDSGAPCATCHAAHGVSPEVGSPLHNSHLIDFDVSAVGAGPGGRREFTDLGAGHGSCNLTCHGVAHADRSY